MIKASIAKRIMNLSFPDLEGTVADAVALSMMIGLHHLTVRVRKAVATVCTVEINLSL